MLNRNRAVYAAHLDQLKYWLELKNIPRRTQVGTPGPAQVLLAHKIKLIAALVCAGLPVPVMASVHTTPHYSTGS
eukprot:9483429-Pyramimonas_sp.AAC.2